MLPAKLPENLFGGIMRLGNLASEDLVETRQVALGWTEGSLEFVRNRKQLLMLFHTSSNDNDKKIRSLRSWAILPELWLEIVGC